MSKLKTLLIVVLIGLLSGCSAPKCTSTDGHEWTKWENVWNKPNEVGNMRQKRHCKKCGAFQSLLRW